MQNTTSVRNPGLDGKMTRLDAEDSTPVVFHVNESSGPDKSSKTSESPNAGSPPTKTNYNVVQYIADTEIVEAPDGSGEYATFAEARAAALDYLQDVIDMCEWSIDGLRDSDTAEQYFGIEVVADETPVQENNVQYICSGHYQSIPEAQDKPPQWFVGRLVKLQFPMPGRPDNGEYMWVQVQSHRGDELVGILTNEPLHADLSYGDEILFRPERIVALGSTDGVTA